MMSRGKHHLLAGALALIGCAGDGGRGESEGATTTSGSSDTTSAGASGTGSASVTGSASSGTSSAETTTTTTSGGGETGGELACGAPGTNSYQDGDNCFCEISYEWCTPDLDDYTCCPVDVWSSCGAPGSHSVAIEAECFCEVGFAWCDPVDAANYLCCGENLACEDTAEPGPMCDLRGDSMFCSNPLLCGPWESVAYACEGGAWVPLGSDELDAQCLAVGDDFAYGCVSHEGGAELRCGVGPGDPCTEATVDTCADAELLTTCLYGRLSTLSCVDLCKIQGANGGSCVGEMPGACEC